MPPSYSFSGNIFEHPVKTIENHTQKLDKHINKIYGCWLGNATGVVSDLHRTTHRQYKKDWLIQKLSIHGICFINHRLYIYSVDK